MLHNISDLNKTDYFWLPFFSVYFKNNMWNNMQYAINSSMQHKFNLNKLIHSYQLIQQNVSSLVSQIK